jgi:hypothetical protein
MHMSLPSAARELGWPPPEVVLQPSGSGAAVIAEIARSKIEKRICMLEGGKGARIGVLAPDDQSSMLNSPLALVCEFPRPVALATLHKLHHLAWNFSRTPLLITCEPHRLRAFTCCEPPEETEPDGSLRAEIPEAAYILGQVSNRATALLHWLNLVTGQIQKRTPDRFDRSKTADNSLLKNLATVRLKLQKNGLDQDVIHDLLARMIFIQFLFQREDSSGKAALSPTRLYALYEQGVLSLPYSELGEILTNHADIYALFRYLNERFNGDLFPAKAPDAEESEREWRKEMDLVNENHLGLLREFVQGSMDMGSGQMSLWPHYSFDVIPLEFVSSIYEAFVKKRKGTVYTPVHLVDFLLDGVLPWEGTEWDLKILDPACGSGIFLVRAFQRLVYRWRKANPDLSSVPSDILQRLISRNLTGMDIDPHAVRVASFSLYLAMCDEIDPRHYWSKVRFPRLRGSSLLAKDFFSEEEGGIQTEVSAGKYDLVIGNPPWGKGQSKAVNRDFNSQAPMQWAERYGWKVSYQDIGSLFVAKAACLTRPDGMVSMVQPTGTLLTNRSKPALELRRRLFGDFSVIEVVNLSTLRFGLFKKAVGPASLLTLSPKPPKPGHMFEYIVVKPVNSIDDEYRFVIEPFDIHEVSSIEAAENPWVWTAFTWGGDRDFAFLKRLAQRPNLNNYLVEGKIRKRRGIIRGDRRKEQKGITNRRMFTDSDFPEYPKFSLDAFQIPINKDAYTHSKESTDLSAFEPPQLLLKLGMKAELNRMRAAMVSPPTESLLCSDSYASVHAVKGNSKILDSALLAINSRFGAYFLFLTSGRLSNYRPACNVDDFLSIPLPDLNAANTVGMTTFEELDERAREAYGFKEAEWALIEDLFDYTLPCFKSGKASSSRLPTRRNVSAEDDGIGRYCRWLIRVLRASFGQDKDISATIFEESGKYHLPLRLVAIHLEWPGSPPIMVNKFDADDLSQQLLDLENRLAVRSTGRAYRFQRIARIFDTSVIRGMRVPTVYIVKPDEVRYWTRTMAMRDGDEIAMEILNWRGMAERQ